MPAVVGYTKGSPMGGDLRVMPEDAKAPSFMVYALRDPVGANLDRIQIVKGWLDKKGNTQEKVYDIVWSGDRSADANGKLPAVGNTVDVGAAELQNRLPGIMFVGNRKIRIKDECFATAGTFETN